jgi:hypothetical protein
MKKVFLIISLIITAAMLFASPLVFPPFTVFAAEDSNPFTPPTQDSMPFSTEQIDVADIPTWASSIGGRAVSQSIDRTNIDSFQTANKFAPSMPDSHIGMRSATIIAQRTSAQKATGYYTSPEFTLPANGYYQVSVDYYVLGENSYFYMGGKEIALSNYGAWKTASYFVKTDILAEAKYTAELYLGSKNGVGIHGAVYYDNFTVRAITLREFNGETGSLAVYEKKIDLTDEQVSKRPEDLKQYTNTDFEIVPPNEKAQSLIGINTSAVPQVLKFENRDYFYPAAGINGEVMLLSADNSFAGIELKENFTPEPHKMYMFQFYSVGNSADGSGFYFRVGEDYNAISSADYKYHNGWQLNTVFLTGDSFSISEDGYKIGFYVGLNSTSATGWLAVSDLSVTCVSGDYAAANASANGVQRTMSLNTRSDTTLSNSNFFLGTASAITIDGEYNTQYPYPLTATAWTAEGNGNGIVNTKYWTVLGVPNPGQINGYVPNNNVYMLQTGSVTSPALTLSAGANYISFDAKVNKTYTTKAVLKYGDLVLGEIRLNHTDWHRYEFAVTEGTNITERSYTLSFAAEYAGAAFFDNVKVGTSAAATDLVKTTEEIDLANPVKIKGIWESTTEGVSFAHVIGADGCTLLNERGTYTTVKNNFTYTSADASYYQLTVTARGTNAGLAVDGYDEAAAVEPTAGTPIQDLKSYTLYFYNETAGTITLLVRLGTYTTEDDGNITYQIADGSVYITKIDLTTVTEDVYNAKKEAAEDDSLITILTASSAVTTTDPITETETEEENDIFGKNWWYLIPSVITAVAIVVGLAGFLLRRLRFNRHITQKGTSYARDVRIEKARKKIVAAKAAKADNITDGSKND